MRGRIIAAAVGLLAEHGAGAVQARAVARDVGASTMAVYHYFGGMRQLFLAMSEEGFHRLDRKLAEVVPGPDPVTDALRLALAYRESARENPRLYDLMFGLSVPGGHSPEEHAPLGGDGKDSAAQHAFAHIVNGSERLLELGETGEHEPTEIAAQLWSLVHGCVSLELAGHLDGELAVERVLMPMGTHLFRGIGIPGDHIERSWARLSG